VNSYPPRPNFAREPNRDASADAWSSSLSAIILAQFIAILRLCASVTIIVGEIFAAYVFFRAVS
jgi:hypothetical protein